jgi:serine/threonine-protein kinase
VAIVRGALLVERYRAAALLGRGGMGEVWRCHDLEQGHDVAVKAIRAELLSDPGVARLFQSEVVAVARLNHPGVIPVYDPGVIPVYDLRRDERGAALLVMELRRGLELGELAREGLR